MIMLDVFAQPQPLLFQVFSFAFAEDSAESEPGVALNRLLRKTVLPSQVLDVGTFPKRPKYSLGRIVASLSGQSLVERRKTTLTPILFSSSFFQVPENTQRNRV